MSSINVEEIRSGLYRLHWRYDAFEDGGVFKQIFHLCGPHEGKAYELTCDRIPVERSELSSSDESDDDDSDYTQRPYSVFISIKRSLLNSGLSDSGLSDESSSMVPQPLIHQEMLPQRPAYVWLINEDNSDDVIQLDQESKTEKWAMSTLLEDFVIDESEFSLWMDFGMAYTQGEKSILNGLAEMFLKQRKCDVKFQFNDGRTIGAHMLILSTASPVFAAMFQSGFVELQTRQVIIDDIDPEVFTEMLRYLYTGKTPKLEDIGVTHLLYEAADKYDIQALKIDCVDILMLRVPTQVTEENAIDILIWCDLHSITELVDSVMKLVENTFCQICFRPEWQTMIKNYPGLAHTAALYHLPSSYEDSQ